MSYSWRETCPHSDTHCQLNDHFAAAAADEDDVNDDIIDADIQGRSRHVNKNAFR